MTPRRRRDEAGSVMVELVGYAFAVAMVSVIAVQGIFLAQATSIAQQAARDGARAPALGRSVASEVHEAIPGWITLEDVRTTTPGGAVQVEVDVRVPFVLAGVYQASFVVTRSATMPGS